MLLSNMDPFNTTPDTILDLIFLKLNEEDIHETLRVSKSWFWASIRRMKKLKITSKDNPLKAISEFYNIHRPKNEEEMDWSELFKHLVLDELVVSYNIETTRFLANNGCNTARLTIEASNEESLLTLSSLKNFIRLKSFEYCANRHNEWHPFIIECLKSSHCAFDPNNECPIAAMKLNTGAWNTEAPVLLSVTKLSVWNVAIDFLRTMIYLCPNLEELYCFRGVVTLEWHHVIPANVKVIELHHFSVDRDVAAVVDASTDSARQLLPYIYQNWESVEKFHFDGYINFGYPILYQAFPQQREETLVCKLFNLAIKLASPLFECRNIHVKCDGQKALQLIIPPARSVKFEFRVERDFKFSPRDVCLEPGKVEHLSVLLRYPKGFALEPFGPNSFDGFCRLNSLTLSHVSALTIRMALDQCSSIKKLKLEDLVAHTIGNMPRAAIYESLRELIMEKCKEPMDTVFRVFPCLLKFKQSAVFEKQEMRNHKTDWLCRQLMRNDKMYGIVCESLTEFRYMVSDDLQASLSKAQRFLNQFLESELHVKGFKLIPRVSKQKVFYLN